MKRYTMDQLVRFPEDQALTKHFNSLNYRWFRLCLFVFSGYVVISLALLAFSLFSFSFDALLANAPYAGSLLALFFLNLSFFMGRSHRFTEENFYSTLLLYLFLLLLFLVLARQDYSGVSFWLWFFPLLFPLFRLRLAGYALLSLEILGLAIFDSVFPDGDGFLSILLGGELVIFLAIGLIWTDSSKRQFLEVWRIERNNRERLRMKDELNHARDIQLSLLPPDNGDIANLDISGVSIPATEVGGDYYEYFEISPQELALVMGDVSGHGVASGMALSGLRSCLYLLKENERLQPAETLTKLNRMMKQTTDKRMFMTFLMLLFDTKRGKLTLANAGHPPLIHFDAASKKVREIRKPALPLGGFLKAEFEEHELDLKAGDVYIAYTDGLTEAFDANGAEYGVARLLSKARDISARRHTANAIREALMFDISRFMKDEEQMDDITLVVVKVKQIETLND